MQRWLSSALIMGGPLVIGLSLIIWFGLDLLGYEGQLVNRFDAPTTETAEIKGDNTLAQTFLAPLDGLRRVDVVLRTYGRRNTRDVTFYLKQSPEADEIIYQETFNAAEIRNNQWRTFEFPPIPDSAGKSFFFYFASPESVAGDAITVGGSEGDFYNGGNAYLGSIAVDADLAFRTYYGLSNAEKLAILGQRLVEDKPSIWRDIRFYVLLLVLYGLILIRFFTEVIGLVHDES